MVSRLVGRRRKFKKRSRRREDSKKRKSREGRFRESAFRPATKRLALHLFLSTKPVATHYLPSAISEYNFDLENRSATCIIRSILILTPSFFLHIPEFPPLPSLNGCGINSLFWNPKCLGLAAYSFAIRNSLCAKKFEFAFGQYLA